MTNPATGKCILRKGPTALAKRSKKSGKGSKVGKKSRKSPALQARYFPVGLKAKGAHGKLFVVKSRKSSNSKGGKKSSKFWAPVKKSKKSGSKKSKK